MGHTSLNLGFYPDERKKARTQDDMIRVPGNSHGTIPERAPTKRSSSLLVHLAHSPSALVQVPFMDKRLTLKHLFKSYPLKPTSRSLDSLRVFIIIR